MTVPARCRSRDLSDRFAIFSRGVPLFVSLEFVEPDDPDVPALFWTNPVEGAEAACLSFPVKYEGDITVGAFERMMGEIEVRTNGVTEDCVRFRQRTGFHLAESDPP